MAPNENNQRIAKINMECESKCEKQQASNSGRVKNKDRQGDGVEYSCLI